MDRWSLSGDPPQRRRLAGSTAVRRWAKGRAEQEQWLPELKGGSCPRFGRPFSRTRRDPNSALSTSYHMLALHHAASKSIEFIAEYRSHTPTALHLTSIHLRV